jgi:hypothetical protein
MAVPGTKITAHKQGLQAGEASHIHAVVVFLDQAQIKRRAEAPVAPGLNRCLLEIEAFDVDERSTEASVRGEGDVVGVMVREVPSQAAPQQIVRDLDEQRRAVSRKRDSTQQRIDIIDKQRHSLESDGDELFEDGDLGAIFDASPAAAYVQAEQRALPTAFEYQLKLPMNLTSGGGETLLPLQTRKLTGSFFHYAVPSVDQLTYLVCEASSDGMDAVLSFVKNALDGEAADVPAPITKPFTLIESPAIRVVEAPAASPPFEVDALALEEDTSLILSADTYVQETSEHPIRLMTALHTDDGHAPGSVLDRGGRPRKLFAVVHDLEAEPTTNEAWINAALSAVLVLGDKLGVRAMGLDPLGSVHGRRTVDDFRSILEKHLANEPPRVLEKIWIRLPLR